MLFYQSVLIDLATFAGLTILYVAYDLYVSRLQPARSRARTATREQRTPATVLRFATDRPESGAALRRRNAACRRTSRLRTMVAASSR